jgi:molybdopterin-guanine dinucleotide biosynthesis protein MobB
MKIFGVIGEAGAGKTALVTRLVAELAGRGIVVSTVKAAPPEFDVDEAGKDSYRHRTAGATEVVLASRKRFALMHELRGEAAPDLETLFAKLAPVDLVLVDGFPDAPHPKLHVQAPGSGPLSCAGVKAIVGTSEPSEGRPTFAPEDSAALADFILAEVGL